MMMVLKISGMVALDCGNPLEVRMQMVVEVLMSQLTDFVGWKKQTVAVVENLIEVALDLNSLPVVVLSH